ncbi:uncharacterized protein Z520_04380 [Fonsecaea multimorphosa CBS 102226]|uniref:Rab-GAP TBC domain-containing protein n=1 Tax=Fonsecaea multimorphosa CBS 102226 TaxID=1442371 RepID=A0A0D2K963_9EURO|nr:uncharacterized protein Z520_04380 [Fonsecaea multimorphosa CBS 102226]KIX99744.1 hypothetical protein Z520_04380 [Fonsecaea multimorphosa CBS 102226]OAL26534.1 hypothetical protein AYO22_04145 [Fonsecaea multimorphosa]
MGDYNASASASPSTSGFNYTLQGLPYSETRASKPPIPVTRSISSLHRLADLEPDKPQNSPLTGDTASISSNKRYNPHPSQQDGDGPRTQIADSISARESQTSTTLSLNTRTPTVSSLTSATLSIPQIRVNETAFRDSLADRSSNISTSESGRWLSLGPSRSSSAASFKETGKDTLGTSPGFNGLSLDISLPTTGFGEELLPTTNIEFSKRGSMLIDGRRVNQSNRKSSPNLAPIMDEEKKTNGEPGLPGASSSDQQCAPAAVTRTPSARPSGKILSADEELLSEKVRAFYAAGTDGQQDTESNVNLAVRMGARWQSTLGADAGSVSNPSLSRATSTTDIHEEANNSRQPSMATSASHSYMVPEREENELAGGLEDWKDINNADVDRYGFIIAKAPSTTVDGTDESKAQRLTRVSTSLQLASETPRRKNTLRRTPSSAHGSLRSLQSKHTTPENTPPRPVSSQSAYARPQRRSASTRIPIPGSKNRRLMDSAMDMLTLPNSAQSVVENGHVHIDNARARRKELEREAKWRRMAKAKTPSKDPETGKPLVGAGSESEYTFDTTNPKLVERTWKGIPDKWRATAWHSFLSASASKRKNYLSDADLTSLFHSYQDQASPDDVQIDLDVPRTISSHIMFRRRYRGGQRLLFRVLHAMSLHIPSTGYVQGMAALAVTLLAYYDEEKAFVMLVRMWELRGLGELYKSGFGGLMAALDDFEKGWLDQGEVARKLESLNIGPTAYGTRWYLTLFNYAIPFPAQLRVWDVFMLLGDDTTATATDSSLTTAPNPGTSSSKDNPEGVSFGTTLDVLHAASAALIDGMRDILLESDFENAMKVMTSWIPIQDEDLFMRIARAEWKIHSAKIKAR